MTKKIIKLAFAFVIMIFSLAKASMAVQYTYDMWYQAENNLDYFLNMGVESYTDGSTNVIGRLTHTRSAYCVDPDNFHGQGNSRNMRTYVVDVGANGMDSVNGLSTKTSTSARAAMEVLYYATKSYENNESRTFGADNTPYKMMMQGNLINKAGSMLDLFGGALAGKYYDLNGKMYPGQPAALSAEANSYVDSTVTYSFADRSTKDVQIMYEDGDWLLVGPYKIENSGSGSITNITAVSKTGVSYEAEGWATSLDASTVRQDKNLPHGTEFYIAFRNNKPDSVDRVDVKKQATNVLRARMIFCQSDGGQNIAIYGGRSSSTVEQSIRLPGVPFSYIKITKTEEHSGNALANVGFKVSWKENENAEEKWVQDGVPAKYVDSRDDATTYITNSQGIANIRNLSKKGIYTIYEIINPNFGFVDTSEEDPCRVVVAEIKAVGQMINLRDEVTNERRYIKLSGFVWEDMISEKQSIRNYLYNRDENDDFDKLIANMKVSLKDKDGNLLRVWDEENERYGDEIQPRRTDQEGKYIFGDYWQEGYENEKILIDDIVNGAYIEFEYNGMTYKSVPLYQTLNEQNSFANKGSRATDETNRNNSGENNPYFYSTRYATVTSNEATDNQGRVTSLEYDYANNKSKLKYAQNTGDYIYGYDGQVYPIDGIYDKYRTFANTKDANNGIMGKGLTEADIYNNNMEEIDFINLGIMQREMPDLRVKNDIQEAKITLNGYGHRYQYAYRYDNSDSIEEYGDDGFNVSVKFIEKYNPSYSREVYSSDIVYNQSQEGNGKLEVYIIYKISIINESTNVYTKINELSNYYDNRLELIATGYGINDDGDVEDLISNEEIGDYNQGGYKKSVIHIGSSDASDITPVGVSGRSNSQEIYIQYKLNNDAVNAALNEDVILNSIVEVTSYSSFENGFESIYSGVDRDSRPDSVNVGNSQEIQNTTEDDTESAPAITIRSPETRTIKGTVWEDSNIIPETNTGYEKRREGNGIYDSTEDVISGVKVDLINLDDNGNIAQLYRINRSTRDTWNEDATYTTGADGTYTLEGVIPGNYLLRYTYSDGTTKIVDADGNETSIEVEKYKSTKFRGYDTSSEDNADDNRLWYRRETSKFDATRLSDARDIRAQRENGEQIEDIVQDRITQREYNYAETNESREVSSIQAESKEFTIDIEHDINADMISQYGADLEWIFDNIDFGIVRRPLQELKVTKEISYIEIVLANGQTVIRGDPRNERIQGLKYLPDEDGSGGIVYLEIDNEIIQGAVLNVEYEIKVDTTNAEVDYNDEQYYYYNRVPDNYQETWKMVTVNSLYDYVTNDLNYDENNQEKEEDGSLTYGWESVTIGDTNNGYFSEEVFNEIKKYTKILDTDYFSDMTPELRIKTAKLYLSRLLANNEMDFTFDNNVEVNTSGPRPTDNSTPGNSIPGDPIPNSQGEPDEDVIEIVITGPTGVNLNYITYIILGVVCLVTFTTGIIFLKRIVLRR